MLGDGKELSEFLYVNCGWHDDQLQLRIEAKQNPQTWDKKVLVKVSLMNFVQDNYLVLLKLLVFLHFSEEHSVSEKLDPR